MMKRPGFNPFLPSWEYVPDGEPHVFGNRVYLYGSHDRFSGHAFCLNDYVCYSAPIDDLTDWTFEGVIYGRRDDPLNADGDQCLYAPDVCMGSDGRYYLYYMLDAASVVSVAVCDTPAGRYRFYGHVRHPDGTLLGERAGDEPFFDPGVLFEDGKLFLYGGSCLPMLPFRHGPMVTVLDADMLTVIQPPSFIAPSAPYSSGTGYEGHEYFEAASIRKIGKTYYFIYSSVLSHELCYATSESPVEGFQFRGTLISNADIGIGSYKSAEKPMAVPDNVHGSIEQINGKWYVFYHRHTNNFSFSRQACLEPIEILPDGSIPQVEISSCGPNRAPLPGRGTYPAYIACNLYCDGFQNIQAGSIPGQRHDPHFPYLTQDGKDGDEICGHVANLGDGAMVGYKYFDCQGSVLSSVTTRGWCYGGVLELLESPESKEVLGQIPIGKSNEWKNWPCYVTIPDGVHALYFRYKGYGYIDLFDFALDAEK